MSHPVFRDDSCCAWVRDERVPIADLGYSILLLYFPDICVLARLRASCNGAGLPPSPWGRIGGGASAPKLRLRVLKSTTSTTASPLSWAKLARRFQVPGAQPKVPFRALKSRTSTPVP